MNAWCAGKNCHANQERETRGDREEAREMLQVPVLPHHRRNRPDGSAVVSSANTDGLPPDVSKFPGVYLSTSSWGQKGVALPRLVH